MRLEALTYFLEGVGPALVELSELALEVAQRAVDVIDGARLLTHISQLLLMQLHRLQLHLTTQACEASISTLDIIVIKSIYKQIIYIYKINK